MLTKGKKNLYALIGNNFNNELLRLKKKNPRSKYTAFVQERMGNKNQLYMCLFLCGIKPSAVTQAAAVTVTQKNSMSAWFFVGFLFWFLFCIRINQTFLRTSEKRWKEQGWECGFSKYMLKCFRFCSLLMFCLFKNQN